MSNSRDIHIKSPSFGRLETGEVTLHAPEIGRVVQIGLPRKAVDQVCELEVDVEQDSITVSRSDGRPIQAEVILAVVDGVRDAQPVFLTPQNTIEFERAGDEVTYTHPEDVADVEHFQALATVIAIQARDKQSSQ